MVDTIVASGASIVDMDFGMGLSIIKGSQFEDDTKI